MKPEIIFFSQYKLGGVQNYYHNIIKHLPAGEFTYKWILLHTEGDVDALPVDDFKVPDTHVIKIGKNEPVESYAPGILALISDAPGIIMTNLPTELLALNHSRPSNKAIAFVCHDEVYLPIAIQFAPVIDVYIAHNPQFFDTMQLALPARKDNIYYLPFGIELPQDKHTVTAKNSSLLEVVFLGRLNKLKGIYDLLAIDDILKSESVSVNWTIIGDGPEKAAFISEINSRPNFKHLIVKGGNDLFAELRKKDVFVLPSYLDGMPVALMEAMSCGLVPVMYRFNEGIQKVITKDTGYIVDSGDCNAFAKTISELHNNRERLLDMAKNCLNKADVDFDIKKRVVQYVQFFNNHSELLKQSKRSSRLKLESGKLDRLGLPYFLVKFIRNSIRLIKG